VAIYRGLAGVPPPKMALPYWLLSGLVHASVGLHALVSAVSGGKLAVLDPMMGLHDGALAAALPCTVTAGRAARVLGYESVVTRDAALEASRRPATPLIPAADVNRVVSEAIARANNGSK
jgi:hypothetical protein